MNESARTYAGTAPSHRDTGDLTSRILATEPRVPSAMARDWQPASPPSSEELPHGRRHRAPSTPPKRRPSLARHAKPAFPRTGRSVLVSLILVAAVANLNLSVANVALPSSALAFDASQTQLNLVAVGYSLGLAASVLWLGALGDRYGRKLMLLLGIGLSIPACLVAAFAPTHRGPHRRPHRRRRLGRHGLPDDAGPDHRAVAPGPGRTHSIALWSALGGAIAALGPLVAGFLLERFEWGSVFLVTLPLAAVALFMAWRNVPAHVNETTSGRQPRRILSAVARRRADPGDQLRAGARHGDARHRPDARRRRARRSGSSSASGGRGPAVRPRHRRPADRSGSRPWPASSSSAR